MVRQQFRPPFQQHYMSNTSTPPLKLLLIKARIPWYL